MTLIEAAKHYHENGFNVVPCIGKHSQVRLSNPMSKPQSDQDVSELFNDFYYDQIAIVCGEVSGNLQVIDIDLPKEKANEIITNINIVIGDVLPIVSTPRGGVHIYFKSNNSTSNLRLSKKIDLRGNRGYVVAPPSDGYTSAIDVAKAPMISSWQRAAIIAICIDADEEE